jgi:cell fate regulator YaaT (PSP1 superfamily)
MAYSYLVRYGLRPHVGRFASDGPGLERGQAVVVLTDRGSELGEVLIGLPGAPAGAFPPAASEPARVLRPAGPDDLETARWLERDRPRRFDLCRRVIADHDAPVELIDVEPLLDGRRTVLHYLGPHQLDARALVAALSSTGALDVVLEPAGRDLPSGDIHGCGHCDCRDAHEEPPGERRPRSGAAHGGCSDCGTGCALASARSVPPVPTPQSV